MNESAGIPNTPDTQPDVKTCNNPTPTRPAVAIPVDVAGALYNAVLFAMKNGAYCNLPVAQQHQMTGYLLTLEHALQPWSNG